MIQCFAKNESTLSFENDNIPQLISASKIHKDFSMYPRILHKHEDRFEMLLICEGEGRYHVGNKSYPIQAGDLIICNKDQIHDEIPGEKTIVSSFAIAARNIHYNGLEEGYLISNEENPIIQTGEFFQTYQHLWETLYQFLASSRQNPQICHHTMMCILSLTMELLDRRTSLIPEKKQEPGKNSTRSYTSMLLLSIKDYLDKNYHDDLTLTLISKEFSLDPYYLSHAFKKLFCYSPMQYVYRRRIGEAQSLLIDTDHRITDISSRVGFGNPNNFNIQFKKYVGLSPLAYRCSYVKPDHNVM